MTSINLKKPNYLASDLDFTKINHNFHIPQEYALSCCPAKYLPYIFSIHYCADYSSLNLICTMPLASPA